MASKPKPPNKNQLPLLSQTAIEGPKGLVALEDMARRCEGCEKCTLHESRTRIVLGEGPWNRPKLMIVGEAPGFQEDKEGRPFVGRSGQLLNAMLRRMRIAREEVFITNTVLCRPNGNRTPQADEVAACAPNLVTQIEAVNPQIILAMGKTAAKALVTTDQHMRWLRSRWHEWRGRKVRVTWHPSYILRKTTEGDGGQSKLEAWADLTEVLIELGMEVPDGPGTPIAGSGALPPESAGVEQGVPEALHVGVPDERGDSGGAAPVDEAWGV
jgi:DNA polymerase